MQAPEQPLYFEHVFSIWLISTLQKVNFTLKLPKLNPWALLEVLYYVYIHIYTHNPENLWILQYFISAIEVSLVVWSKLISIHEKAPGY